jgi:hypothetical protein
MKNRVASKAVGLVSLGLAILPGAACAEGPLSRDEIMARLPSSHLASTVPLPACTDLISDIKARGVSFQPNMADGSNISLGCEGSPDTDVYAAISANFGPRPDAPWFTGAWRVLAVGAPLYPGPANSFFMGQDPSGAGTGSLSINEDGSYMLQIASTDGLTKPIKGSWRQARPDERGRYYGGDALVLLKAEGGDDWLVTKYGLPDRDEIEVLDLKLRGNHHRFGDR